MKSLVILLVAGAVALGPSMAVAQQVPVNPNLFPSISVRVACFSPQRAFSESAEGKATIAKLTALQSEKARAVDEKNKTLQAQEQALEQSSSLLSDAARAQRTNDVEKLRVDVQRFIEDAQAELASAQREAENAFAIKLTPTLTKIAQRHGLSMIFNVDEGPIAWFDPTLDVTPEVIQQLASQ